MVRMAKIFCGGAFCALLLAVATNPAFGQGLTNGSIGGVVKDSTGAVVPDTKVEVSSPALIEKVRATVTSSGGEYQFINLPIGTYTVTFTRTGFKSLQRQNVVLTAGFDAPVDASLALGEITQTVEVTSASPVVDIENVTTQNVLDSQQLDALPTTQSLADLSQLTLGASTSASSAAGLDGDVGGNRGEQIASMAVHGGNQADEIAMINGLSTQQAGTSGSGYYRLEFFDPAQTGEISIVSNAGSGVVQTAGVQVNMVPKSGSDNWHFHVMSSGTNGNFENSNLDANLISRGVITEPGTKNIYDLGGGVGGPIIKGKVWMYLTASTWGATQTIGSNWYNSTQGTFTYTPELNNPATRPNPNKSLTGNFTWQVGTKDQFSFFPLYQDNCNCRREVASSQAPEATSQARYVPMLNMGGTWTHTVSKKVLLEAGVLWVDTRAHYSPAPEVQFGDAEVTNSSTGFIYNFEPYGFDLHWHNPQVNGYVSTDIIEGNHNLKFGYTFLRGSMNQISPAQQNPPIAYTLTQATSTSPLVPSSITEYALPNSQTDEVVNMGLYAQDQWRLKRLTLSYGLRFDYLNAWVPAGSKPDSPFVAGFSFNEVDNVPDWKDINPRVGASYDVFGNGKTAVKFSWGRYVEAQSVGIAAALNPTAAITSSATRTWTDPSFNPATITRNYVPCNLLSPAAQPSTTGPGCGAVTSTTFGKTIPTTTYSTDVTTGWDVRPAIYETSALVQQQLHPGVALTAGYYRTTYTNQTVTRNTAVPQTAYDPYSVTLPVDTRLPGGGGQTVSGFYDIQPAYSGLTTNEVFRATNYGHPSQVYNGFDVNVSARMRRGIMGVAGMSDGQTDTNNCFIVNSPQDLHYCDVVTPWKGQLQFKGNVIYPLPWKKIRVSAIYQNISGVPIAASWAVPNATLEPSLGRNLTACNNQTEAPSACHSTATVSVVQPNTYYENRLQQVDMEFSKVFGLRKDKYHITGNIGMYNLFNANTILNRNNTYGSAYGTPTDVLAARLFKFGVDVAF